jgi:hypothetical protein
VVIELEKVFKGGRHVITPFRETSNGHVRQLGPSCFHGIIVTLPGLVERQNAIEQTFKDLKFVFIVNLSKRPPQESQ